MICITVCRVFNDVPSAFSLDLGPSSGRPQLPGGTSVRCLDSRSNYIVWKANQPGPTSEVVQVNYCLDCFSYLKFSLSQLSACACIYFFVYFPSDFLFLNYLCVRVFISLFIFRSIYSYPIFFSSQLFLCVCIYIFILFLSIYTCVWMFVE